MIGHLKRFYAVLLLMLFMIPLEVYCQQPYIVSSTEFVVFRDGVVQITQEIYVDETVPSISLALFSKSPEKTLAVDQASLPLSLQLISPPNLTIITLGSSKVTLSYLASDLTRKNANVWTLSVNTTYQIATVLPDDSRIVYLSDLPSSITSKDSKTVIVIPAGDWEISYTVPVAPSPSPSSTPASTATVTPTIPPQPTPSTTAPPTTTTQTTSPTNTQPIPSTTTTAPLSPTTTVSEMPQLTVASLQYVLVIVSVSIIAVAVVIFIFLMIRRGQSERARFALRPEDKELLEYLSERGGRVLESELRQRFNLPRSSMWRTAKRLEALGYVRISKVGIQNQIELVRRIL